MQYQLLDCGNKRKIEQFGNYKLIRPCPQAFWEISDPKIWEEFDSEFVRTGNEKGVWKTRTRLPKNWEIQVINNLKFKIEPNEFGNVGVFTEHWQYLNDLYQMFDPKDPVLSLFSYTGSTSVPLVSKGYKVTVVDSSKNAITDYATNLEINHLSRDGQRLILEDAIKFIKREIRRNKKYASILVDAPSFGRGTKGEIFNIEDHLEVIIDDCKKLLTPNGKLVLTLHSPRFTPSILEIFIQSKFKNKQVLVNEIINPCTSKQRLPSGFLVKVF